VDAKPRKIRAKLSRGIVGNVGKRKFQYGGKKREIDCAVPRDKPVVAINIR